MKATTLALALLTAAASPALAHTGVGATHSFLAGVSHPLLGLDHVLAMAAVGAWAGLNGGRAVWAWPLAFVGLMVAAALLALAGVAAPGGEIGIGLSVLVLGTLVALRLPLTLAAGAAICGAFALFHGHAHGAELPAGAGAGSYVAGFVLATAILHAAGVGLGLASGRLVSPWLARAAGGAVALAGVVLLVG
ncbi:HupE/UreJ family protein [Salinarimonas soli]|uniref:HupE/UreJ family protein n=1 Tax=Salinarimonas soli TaxID=1638099 RepID=A0A5B2VVH1_9HYPH|nr:HupE/UreJ family protein [Salinarimonas soli]KAA2242267.1 HupE/UreJ family protein [Salinarimonas soli]